MRLHTSKLVNFLINFPVGKGGGLGKAKNSKKSVAESTDSPLTTKKTDRIPRINPMLDIEPDEEQLGQGRVQSYNHVNKFSGVASNDVKAILDTKSMLPVVMSSLCDELKKLVVYSATNQTWAKHCSAWRLYNKFCLELSVKNQLPVPVEYVRALVTWTVTKRGLKSSTVQSYVSSLNTAHVISNHKCPNFSSDLFIKMALKGAKNMYQIFNAPKADRLPINIRVDQIF